MKSRALFLGLVLSLTGFSSARADEIRMTVFAASSLAQTFTDLGKSFESTHPGVKIVFSFQSSSALAAQLNAGAPADVFASASEIDMAKAKDRVPEPTSFVSNRIVLGVLPTSHVPINKMIDLNKRNVTWIQCAHSAPCGAATDKALSVFGKVTSHPVSFEANASSVVAKLTSGEVDAAFIYHTDFVAHSTIIKEIRFGDTPSTQTVYSIGVVRDAKSKDQAEQFVKLVLSSKGLALLLHAGFSRITR